MSDLIKREDAMGAVQDHFNADGFKGYDDGQKMMDRIKALPSAEPIVRCKDCVRKQEWLVDYTHDSDWFCTLHECAMNDDDFCSYGERKGGDSE